MTKVKYDIFETIDGIYQTTFTKKHLARKPWVPVNPKDVRTVIPGTVVEFRVKEGQSVEVGEILVIFKAMKMNNNVRASMSGVIKKIHVAPGENLPSNALILEME